VCVCPMARRTGPEMNVGAHYLGNGKAEFSVWSPLAKEVSLGIVEPAKRVLSMKGDARGYWYALADDVPPGALYHFILDSQKERPDPMSQFQPGGVHGPSAMVDHSTFPWDDGEWKGIGLEDFIIYELHIGTYSGEGTFEAIIPSIDYLKRLGVTVIELMPVAQFPGKRNWGYDGVYLFAPQNSYGGPEGLKKLVNACHEAGMGIMLDVVYNHLGPEGNYLADFGPYFTNRYKTPWGDAINFDGPCSDEVRRFFIENALYWVTEYHFDALRIDAIHGIYDFSARHIVEELADEVHREAKVCGRKLYVIPESDLNDVRVIKPISAGGYGVDAQWNDDFHHALHSLITKERSGYYQDFGRVGHLTKAFKEGFVYSGQYSAFRRRRHGSSSKNISARHLVVFSQNHDQVGNRLHGDRLSQSLSFEQLKLAATVVLLSPFVPLLFMGEEYGETAPFCYFVSHSDPDLAQKVKEGRQEEFAGFGWDGIPPDPGAEETFQGSRLNPNLREKDGHSLLLRLYMSLVSLRKELRSIGWFLDGASVVQEFSSEKAILVADFSVRGGVCCIYSFNEEDTEIAVRLPSGLWEKVFDTAALPWGVNALEETFLRVGEGSSRPVVPVHAWSALVYRFLKPEEE
jgi:maltooligosyltrehalose trehalohydrolase